MRKKVDEHTSEYRDLFCRFGRAGQCGAVLCTVIQKVRLRNIGLQPRRWSRMRQEAHPRYSQAARACLQVGVRGDRHSGKPVDTSSAQASSMTISVTAEESSAGDCRSFVTAVEAPREDLSPHLFRQRNELVGPRCSGF
jgi:hypothetical protein